MIRVFDKKIIGKTVKDARFPDGKTIESLFDLEFEVGAEIRLDFDDNTSVIFCTLENLGGDDLVIMRAGSWREEDGRLIHTDDKT